MVMTETNSTLQKISKVALIVGIVAALVSALGWLKQPEAFAFAYLWRYVRVLLDYITF